MKELFFIMFYLFILTTTSFGEIAVVEDSNRVIFKTVDTSTTSTWLISSIAWVSGEGTNEISATSGMLLEDGDGVEIFSCEATTVSDQCIITFPQPILVNGMKAEDLDAGVLTIFGSRR